jgi:glycosyltransferase involved in cell wall biosynthesis
MRIVVAHNRYRSNSPSGENQVVDREAELLRRAGHEVVAHERESDEIRDFSPVDKALIPARIVWSGPERCRFSQMLRQVRPDVVHVHNTFPLLSPSVVAACRQHDVPVVMTLHNFRLICSNAMLSKGGEPCRRCVGRMPAAAVRHGCYRGSSVRTLPVAAGIATHRVLRTWRRLVGRFVVPSEFSRRILAAGGLPHERMIVKPHFVDDPGRVRDGAGHDVLYLGRLSSEKGIDLLIEAWAQRTEQGRLLIVGDGPLRQRVQRWADDAASVTYLGPQDRSRCVELLLQARCVVVPSAVEESFGLAVVEAFACGVPVIATAMGALCELVVDGQSGWVVPSGDAGAMADRIDRALTDPELASIMGKHARKRYEERYSAEVNLAVLEGLYDQVMRGDAA